MKVLWKLLCVVFIIMGGTGGGHAGRREHPERGLEGVGRPPGVPRLWPGRDLLLLALFLWACGFHFSSTTAGGDRDWLEAMLFSLSAAGQRGHCVTQKCKRPAWPLGLRPGSNPGSSLQNYVRLQNLIFIIWKNEDNRTDMIQSLEGPRRQCREERSPGPSRE